MGRISRIGVTALMAATLVGAPAAAHATANHTDAAVKVRIVNFAFKPANLTISAGMRVKWINKTTTTTHTSTSDTGVWDSGNIPPGGKFAKTFKRVGTFDYHCSIHPFMTGSIKVTP